MTRRPHFWLGPAVLMFTASCGGREPCEPGVRRNCEAAGEQRGGELCTEGGHWSGQCEVLEIACDPEMCESYGLCRRTKPAKVSQEGLLSYAEGVLGNAYVEHYYDESRNRYRLAFQPLTVEGYQRGNAKDITLPTDAVAYPIGIVALVASQNRFLLVHERGGGTGSVVESAYMVLTPEGMTVHERQHSLDPLSGQLYWYGLPPAADESSFRLRWWDAELRGDVVQTLGLDGELDGSAVQLQEVSSTSSDAYAWTGTEHVMLGANICWLERRAADGSALGTRLRVPPTEGTCVRGEKPLVWNGEEFAVAWVEGSPNSASLAALYFARISVTGEWLGEPLLVSESERVTQSPHLVWAEDSWVLMWSEERENVHQAYLQRLSPAEPERWNKMVLNEGPYLAGVTGVVAEDALSVRFTERDDSLEEVEYRSEISRIGWCE